MITKHDTILFCHLQGFFPGKMGGYQRVKSILATSARVTGELGPQLPIGAAHHLHAHQRGHVFLGPAGDSGGVGEGGESGLGIALFRHPAQNGHGLGPG